MANLRRVPYTKPIPACAEIITRKGERFARFKDKKGKTVLAPLVEDSQRIRLFSRKWYGEYKDGEGVERCVPLSANKAAAEQMLADLVRKAERVRANVITPAEGRMADHQAVPIARHFDAYRDHLQAAGVTEKRLGESRHHLDTLATDCAFARLLDLHREALERWLASQAREGMSARTRNAYRESLVAFCNWCLDTDRLAANPFSRVAKANVKADPKRPRRAMTEDELVRLLDVARRRPLLDAMTIRRGARKGQVAGKVKPQVRERLERLGWERALVYKTLVLTGLRKGELASVTVGQLHLDEAAPYAELDAAEEKNREGSYIAIRPDLADDLRVWLADKLRLLQDTAREKGNPVPLRLLANARLFKVPAGFYRVLNGDLKAAGIPKRDDRGRSLDVHALRTTFGTLLSKGGVQPRTAQSAMRHSTIDLTMNVYTDPRLLDVHRAVEVLPALPLDGGRQTESATGTAGPGGPKACAQLAPAADSD
jgi:integrase